jgi:hypothetical protein
MSEAETTVSVFDEGRDDGLLAVPPRADDLGEALAARPRRPTLPKLTGALAAAVLLCAGFLGGVLVEKNSVGSAGGRGSGAGAAFAGRAGRTGGLSASGSGSGGAISGTVTVVSGDTLYVTAADGSVYTVKTTGSTTVSIAQSGTVSQLKPGQTVTISGSSDTGGNLTATSITQGAGGTGTGSGAAKSAGGQ